MLYHLIIFTLISIVQSDSSCYSKLPEVSIGPLEIEEIDVMLSDLKDYNFMEMLHTYSVQSDPETAYIDNQLYGIYDRSRNTVLGGQFECIHFRELAQYCRIQM